MFPVLLSESYYLTSTDAYVPFSLTTLQSENFIEDMFSSYF